MTQDTHQQEQDPPSVSAENAPKPSEVFPNGAEEFRSVPNASESLPQLSEASDKFTLTVREVAKMLEAAGVARTERSVVNWCQADANGMSRLKARKDPNDGRYYITKESVYLVIEEEQAKTRFGGFARIEEPETNPKSSEQDSQTPSDVEELRRTRRKLEDLKDELRDKEIATRLKDKIIETLQRDRSSFAEERAKYVDALSQTNRQLGRLEGQLRQIGSGSDQRSERDADQSPSSDRQDGQPTVIEGD